MLDIAARWEFLGTALRIKPAELAVTSKTHNKEPYGCLKDVLLAWLQQRYDTKKFSQPSWRMLCQVVHKRVGGNNPALAGKIAENHSVP